ncbi:glucose-1-phosphate cytidylyltransferase [Gammaproteobacteria bacterium]|nr:glucose-1-phosphate cytidylyltransferase [Gammaproteobacteria bacterium]MDA8957338.1 glucose-1-phosphate cytidylyltransferase [Gammaproteobacteria bacterium]MDA9039479.1 glucose-1-phosphate cytidylyltransferase [Gammaproteobacteria bacterium]
MKAVILAGGLGTRLSEETETKPKPMVEIGGKPILWHILKTYSYYGINDFIICCGYKGYLIKEFFANYFLHTSDIKIDFKTNNLSIINERSEPWKVTLVDTGEKSMTGGRLLSVKEYIKDDEAFCFTYGDGLSDINIKDLIKFHKSSNKLATVTAVKPPGRFGSLVINDKNIVEKFVEKPSGDGSRINGGYFVLSPKVLDYIEDLQTIWEQDPMKKLSHENNLAAFNHDGFWQPIDTLREKRLIEELIQTDNAPWIKWSS